MMNVSVKWEIKKEKKQDSNTFQGIVWDVVVFHRVPFVMIGSRCPLHTPTYTFIDCFTRAAPSASSLLLCSTPTLALPGPTSH